MIRKRKALRGLMREEKDGNRRLDSVSTHPKALGIARGVGLRIVLPCASTRGRDFEWLSRFEVLPERPADLPPLRC
jgi:hypothetical protein